jgi:hypothetical protein
MSMADLSAILSQLRAEIESRIREEFSGSSNAGKRILYDMVTPIYVTVKGDLASLRNAVLQRSSRAFKEAERDGRIVVTGHTWKGQQAIQKVRELLTSNP